MLVNFISDRIGRNIINDRIKCESCNEPNVVDIAGRRISLLEDKMILRKVET